MSIVLEHPTVMKMLENPAPNVLAATAFEAATNTPICFDITAHYAAHQTSVVLAGGLALSLCYENDQETQDPGTPKRIIFHWSAGNYNQCWNGYQYGIAYDPKTGKAYAIRFLTGKQKGKHLWGRNTGSIGISLLAMADGQPVTHAQLMMAARLGAEYCAWHNIDPRGEETVPQMECDQPNCNNITATGRSIQMKTVSDHATYAKADGYQRFRVDIGQDLAIVETEMLRVYDALKRHEESFLLLDIIK